MNKHKVVKDREDINQRLKKDDNIHFDKIKKYFENVLNEQHFLNNYARARQARAEASGNAAPGSSQH